MPELQSKIRDFSKGGAFFGFVKGLAVAPDNTNTMGLGLPPSCVYTFFVFYTFVLMTVAVAEGDKAIMLARAGSDLHFFFYRGIL